MKITVLVDNNTLIGNNLQGEPGLSFYIEEDGKKILFDTGWSDLFIKNADKLGISLKDLDYIILSHGHDDHIGGLYHLIEYYKLHNVTKKPILVMHPRALQNKTVDGRSIGNMLSESILSCFFNVKMNSDPIFISENLVYLGEIERNYSFEKVNGLACIEEDGAIIPDELIDDTALAYKSKEGIVIVTGCSHAGICNITSQAERILREDRVCDMIGGLHLLKPSEEKLQGTLNYIKDRKLSRIHPCHCTKFMYRAMINAVTTVEEIGCGSVLEYL